VDARVTGDERRRRLARTRVYLVLDASACPGGEWREPLARALDSGVVGMVQVREKALGDDAFAAHARLVAALARDAGALLILNDRVALLDETGADGVHVGEDDAPVGLARAAAGPDRLVGASAHDRAEVLAAAAAGADYAGLGPCFPTRTKALARTPRGAALVAEATPGAPIPVFPIGGVTTENVAALARAGARRVAVGAGVLGAPDPRAAALAIARALEAP
jgi:thiamine-phosphate pyrophosphorylase